MPVTIAEILKDSAYRLDQFDIGRIALLEGKLVTKENLKGQTITMVPCLVRGKLIKATPEEVVRQLYLDVLHDQLGYPLDRMAVEYEVTFGREKKRADICIFDKDKPTTPYILIELKKPKLKDGKEQLKSYCNATGAPIGVWTNGQQISHYHRKDPNYFEDIPRIPTALEKLSDVLSERWTIDDLIKHDKLVNERKSLKGLVLEMEDEVLANAGVDVFEELFKLIFTKLYDEWASGRDPKRTLVFKNYGDTETELYDKIQDLFDKAKEKWEGVFPDSAKIDLTPSHLAVCVASLESVKLFNSNLEVVDDAFEYLIGKSSKGEKGQYFTPRYVIDMCVRMMNPKEDESLIDTAAGSCGFPVHSMFHVWRHILESEGLKASHLFTSAPKPPRCEDYVRKHVFAIDFDEKTVRVGRTLNLIAGDGQTNVLHLNTLDYERWGERTSSESWLDIYGAGWKRLRNLRVEKKSDADFKFDVLMANPPFAGDIKETRILAKYELARSVSKAKLNNVDPTDKNIRDGDPTFPQALVAPPEAIYKIADGTYRKLKIKHQNKVGRDILFIERNLRFLKPGGRMAVVLPQGRFNNATDAALRDYIADRARIVAVVGLNVNVFKPHTNTKTSVLFVQKWNDDPAQGPLCQRKDDYPIFFATMREPSKDTSGDKIYRSVRDSMDAKEVAEIERLKTKWRDIDAEEQKLRAKEYRGKLTDKERARLDEIEALRAASLKEIGKAATDLDAPLLDTHGHLIVKHDLFNHDGLTQDGIAEEFAQFATQEGLSFFPAKGGTSPSAASRSALSYVCRSQTVFAADRLDAEYFRPKFQSLMSALKRTGQSVRLGDYLVLNKRGKQPAYTEVGVPVINSKHVLRNEIRRDEDNRRATADKDDLKIQAGDVLINGTGVGTIGRAAVYLYHNPALPDNHVTVLRPSEALDPVYLAVYLNSAAGQLQVEQRLRGSSGQIELYPNDIAEFQIWLAPEAVQKRIRQQVEQGFAQRRSAARLLDAANRAVEIGVDQNEVDALDYLSKTTR